MWLWRCCNIDYIRKSIDLNDLTGELCSQSVILDQKGSFFLAKETVVISRLASFAICYKPTRKTEVIFTNMNDFPLSCEETKTLGKDLFLTL